MSRPFDAAALPAHERSEPSSVSAAEQAVLLALREITYGQVEVVVHSSQIVQITRSQKLRLNADR